LLVVVVIVVAVSQDKDDENSVRGTKWAGTLASTVFALDADTGQMRWQTSPPGAPQLIALRMSRPGVITVDGIVLDGPCSGRPVSLDLDVSTGRDMARRDQLSLTDGVPRPPHGPVVAVAGDTSYRVEADSAAGPVVRAVDAAGDTRWQVAFPDPADRFMSVPTVVTGVVDHRGLVVAGSADYLGTRHCGGG
jgi:outer membrane protein assembly factor BamB